MKQKRDVKCIVHKGSFGGYIINVYPNYATSYYHTVPTKEDLLSYYYYYNTERIYPNTSIFQRLYPEGIVQDNKIIVRDLVIP